MTQSITSRWNNFNSYFSVSDDKILCADQVISTYRQKEWTEVSPDTAGILYKTLHARGAVNRRPVIGDPAFLKQCKDASEWKHTFDSGWDRVGQEGNLILLEKDGLTIEATQGLDCLALSGGTTVRMPACRPHNSAGFITFIAPAGPPAGTNLARFYVNVDYRSALDALRTVTGWIPPSLKVALKIVDHMAGYPRTDAMTIYCSRAATETLSEILCELNLGSATTSFFAYEIREGVGFAEEVSQFRGSKSFGQVCCESVAETLRHARSEVGASADPSILAESFERFSSTSWRTSGRDPEAVYLEFT